MRSAAAAVLLAAPVLAFPPRRRALTATFCDDAVCTVGCSAVSGAEGDCIPVDGTDFSVVNVLEGSGIRTDMYAGSNCEVFVTAVTSAVDTCLPGSSLPIPGLAESYSASASRAAVAGSVTLGRAVKARAVGVLRASIARGRNATRVGRPMARLEIQDCTPSSAPVANVRWNAPSEVAPGQTVHVTGMGDLLESMDRPTYDVQVKYLGLPVMTRNGAACGTERIELPLNMGEIDMKMLDCPVGPCSSAAPCHISIDNSMEVALIPPGAVVAEVLTKTDSGADGLCVTITVHG